jgi:hypothetical protein
MFDRWMIDEDMGHGVLVPLVMAWVVWRERARWLLLKRADGLGIFAAGGRRHVSYPLTGRRRIIRGLTGAGSVG